MSKQKKSKTVSVGIAIYKTTFNNTIITISDILEIQFVGLLLELVLKEHKIHHLPLKVLLVMRH
jgi:hypothetical protein